MLNRPFDDDINKDGKGDFAVQGESESGSKGVVRFFYAGWDKDFYQFTGETTADRAGNAVAGIGDMDGNGSFEIIIGARWNDAMAENGGRAYILSLARAHRRRQSAQPARLLAECAGRRRVIEKLLYVILCVFVLIIY